jgi:hypothetical protein
MALFVTGVVALIAGVIFVTQQVHDRYFAKPSQVCVKYKPGSFGVFNSCEKYATR